MGDSILIQNIVTGIKYCHFMETLEYSEVLTEAAGSFPGFSDPK